MFGVGELVVSPDEASFHGIGKIKAHDPEEDKFVVSFFVSPLKPEADLLECYLDDLERAEIFDERVVYCKNPKTNYWQRGRYGGGRPGNQHLFIFRSGESTVLGIEDIYVPRLPLGVFPNPLDFLKGRCTDSPRFMEWRIPYIRSYIEQRANCRSITSIPSSSIQLEHHQIAVVRRVLQDSKRRYLLADEVGLGKTIEAGLILRELLLADGDFKTAVVGAPSSLVEQWKQELSERFHLGEMFERNIFVVEHENLHQVLADKKPKIVVLDEVHQMSSWLWSSNERLKSSYLDVAKYTHEAEACLLLSGTPLVGNELNFLAMLHLLSPEEYSVDKEGREKFLLRVEKRERLGGIYQAFVPENDNASLEDLLDQLAALFPNDYALIGLVDSVRPHIDFFADKGAGESRTDAIVGLRSYIGENYRLHQRMLRNRREDPSVRDLFPGLSGVSTQTYHPSGEPYCIEQNLEEFRGDQVSEDWSGLLVTSENFHEWVEWSFISPLTLAKQAARGLSEFSGRLEKREEELLRSIVDLAPAEQKAKDLALLSMIKKSLDQDGKKQFVIFCGQVEVADHVYALCEQEFGASVERHILGQEIQFISNDQIRLLVCDQFGEDGLNLNGGKKVAVHYGLPVSLPRIEQRLGRLNRYSSSIYAAPVESFVVVPKHGLYSNAWLGLLSDVIDIFKRSIASLQYVLEEEVDAGWRSLSKHGAKAVSDLAKKLGGESGFIVQEQMRVRNQEELNKLDSDIQVASDFAEALNASDETAESNVQSMMDWITEGLQFKKYPGDRPGTFRFQYLTGEGGGKRTMLDVPSLIRYCYPALEKVQQNPLAPTTVLMSADRGISSQGHQVHPMRIGSPFIDALFRYLSDDPRGVASASLRFIKNKLDEPRAFLGMTALVSLAGRNEDGAQMRKADEIFPPQVIKFWVNKNGVEEKKEFIETFLDLPYKDKASSGSSYQDANIRSERWVELENYFPDRHWKQTIDEMAKNRRAILLRNVNSSRVEVDSLHIEWIGAQFIALVGGLK